MTNEEFQTLVLQELKGLKKGQEEIKQEQEVIKKDLQVMNEEQKEIKEDLKEIIEQTANLTEFKEEVNYKLDTMLNEINTLEMVVSKNWQDITKLKAAR